LGPQTNWVKSLIGSFSGRSNSGLYSRSAILNINKKRHTGCVVKLPKWSLEPIRLDRISSTFLKPSIQYAMHFLAQLLCAYTLVAAKPVDHLATTQRSQRVLQHHAPERMSSDPQAIHHTSNFDAAPNSVGLLLTSAGKQEVKHVWLPLGKRIETRKSAAHRLASYNLYSSF
jgi:hypothetical protein